MVALATFETLATAGSGGELLLRVFGHLTLEDRLRCMRVCKQWLKLVVLDIDLSARQTDRKLQVFPDGFKDENYPCTSWNALEVCACQCSSSHSSGGSALPSPLAGTPEEPRDARRAQPPQPRAPGL